MGRRAFLPVFSASGDPCWSALPIQIGNPGSVAEVFFASETNWFYFEKEIGGDAIRIGWSVIHGDTTSAKSWFSRVPFDGHVTVRPLGEGSLQVVYQGDCFPNIESDIVSDRGARTSVLEIRHRGPEQGLSFAGNCTVTSTGSIP